MKPDQYPEILRLLVAAHNFVGQQRREGLGTHDYAVLLYLTSRPQGATPSALGAYLGLGTGTMTKLLHRLQAQGLIERVANREDRRSLTIVATGKAQRMVMDDLHQVITEIDDDGNLNPDQFAAAVGVYALQPRH